MKKQKRVSAKPFWYSWKTGLQYQKKETADCEYFHSILEFKLYTQFLKFIPKEQISRQVPLLYKPKTTVYPATYWKVDFAIELDETLYIEAKGGWIISNAAAVAEFQHKLQALELSNRQAWLNLFLVSEQTLKLDSFYKVLKPQELMDILKLRQATLLTQPRRNHES